MHIVFQYFDGCPNWEPTHERLLRAMDGLAASLTMQLVATPEEAAAVEFRGSPTVLIDGGDPLDTTDAPPVGTLACRLYGTEDGSPTELDLRAALIAAAEQQ